jgi:hypothetical protein
MLSFQQDPPIHSLWLLKSAGKSMSLVSQNTVQLPKYRSLARIG